MAKITRDLRSWETVCYRMEGLTLAQDGVTLAGNLFVNTGGGLTGKDLRTKSPEGTDSSIYSGKEPVCCCFFFFFFRMSPRASTLLPAKDQCLS